MNATVIASILGSIAVIATALASVLARINAKKIDAANDKISEVHILVNNRLDQTIGKLDTAMIRIDALKQMAVDVRAIDHPGDPVPILKPGDSPMAGENATTPAIIPEKTLIKDDPNATT